MFVCLRVRLFVWWMCLLWYTFLNHRWRSLDEHDAWIILNNRLQFVPHPDTTIVQCTCIYTVILNLNDELTHTSIWSLSPAICLDLNCDWKMQRHWTYFICVWIMKKCIMLSSPWKTDDPINTTNLVINNLILVSRTYHWFRGTPLFRNLHAKSPKYSRNLCIAEIVLLMTISSWSFVHAQSLSLTFSA